MAGRRRRAQAPEIDLECNRVVVPAPCVDQIVRTHLRQVRSRSRRAALLCILPHDLEPLTRIPVTALLHVAVSQPAQRVGVARVAGQPLPLDPLVGDVPGRFVRRHHLVPHAQRDEDVRGHVLGVAGGGRDRRVGPRRTQPQRRVHRIIVGVDQVMGGARVLRVVAERFLDDRRRPHICRDVSALVGGSEKRQRVECGRFVVVRILLPQAAHRIGVGEVARSLVAVTVQDIQRAQVVLFAVGRCLGQPRFGRRSQPTQRRQRRLTVLLLPDGMVVRHRLAPVGEGEVGVDALSLAKRLGGVGILEAVEQQNASQEGLLRCRRAGVGELDPPQVRRLGAGRIGQRRGDQDAG